MKKMFAVLFAAGLLAMIPAVDGYAAEKAHGSCGDAAVWTLSDEGQLSIQGNGSTELYLNTEDQPWFEMSREIRSVEIGDGITVVGCGLFRDCVNLTSVSMGDSVTRIGSSAFSGCCRLTDADLSSGLRSIGFEAFKYCGFTEVKLPEGLEILEGRAFYGCENLTAINMPASLQTIETEVFRGCYSLKTEDGSDAHVHAAGGEVVENLIESTYEQGGSYDLVVYCSACGAELSRECVLVPRKEPDKDTPTYVYQEETTEAVKETTAASEESVQETTAAAKKEPAAAKKDPVVDSSKPAATKLSSLSSQKKKTLTVSWKKKSGVTGYQIQYSLRSGFSSAKTAKIKGATKTSLKIGGLNAGKKYYVRVRTYKTVKGKTVYSSWSAAKAVTVKR